MAKKYFVVSDVHGFFSEMRRALHEAGYRKNAKNHILIICGDLFDRGSEALDLYNYIQSIPKERRVLIRGNHEDLFLGLLNKKHPQSHDFHNYTVDTFCQIAQMEDIAEDISTSEYLEASYSYRCGTFWDHESFDSDAQKVWDDVKEAVRKSKIAEWIDSDEWRDYYEVENYIFVHSFLPTVSKDVLDNSFPDRHPKNLICPSNWRDMKTSEWEGARWGCPYELYEGGAFTEEEKKGKILVCGHWHTPAFFEHLLHDYSYRYKCGPIYFSEHLIGIDGGCCYSYETASFTHPQNVLVIDENMECFDKNGNKLEEMKKVL